jgi:hypothetical protein
VKIDACDKSLPIRFLNVAEQVRLVNVCPSDYRLQVQAGLFSGDREAELIRLVAQDFDPENGSVFVEFSKNRKSRHVPLTTFHGTLIIGSSFIRHSSGDGLRALENPAMDPNSRKAGGALLLVLALAPGLTAGNKASRTATAALAVAAAVGGSLPAALAAPAPALQPGPGMMFWQPFGGLGHARLELAHLAGPKTVRDGLEAYAPAEQAPGWALPWSFEANYPSHGCRSRVVEEDLDQLALEYRDLDPGQPFTDQEDTGFSENLEEPWAVEEYTRSVDALVRDLEDYLCQVAKTWKESSAPDRDRVLYDRLVAARGLRQRLAVAQRNAQKTVQACWKRLAKEPERWKEPGDEVIIPEWLFGVSDPLRVDLLQGAARLLEDAKKRFDANVLPLVQELKRNRKTLVVREAEERIEAPAEPGRDSGRGRKRRK